MTTGLRIKDVADRTGFAPSTLRYYEDIGLLPGTARTPSGYRAYDDSTVARLTFIARAKQLGCSLDEIGDLLTAWDGGECGPVQERLLALTRAKIASAEERVGELTGLVGELRRATALLERHRPSGPCDDRCGCVAGDVSPPAAPGPQPVTLTLADRASEGSGAVPIACTLDAREVPDRLAEWDRLLGWATHREVNEGGVRVVFDWSVPVDRLATLMVAEQDCCRFLSFDLRVDHAGIVLDVGSPPETLELVSAMFGAAEGVR